MKMTIKNKKFYLLASDRYEAAYFVRHLDGDELGLQWELKRICNGEVEEMNDEFFFTASDVIKNIAAVSCVGEDYLQMFATLDDEDGSISSKDARIDYVVLAREFREEKGWSDEFTMSDGNVTTYGPEQTIDDADMNDFSWMEEGNRNPLYGYKELERDAKIQAVLEILGTGVIIKKGDKVMASEYELLSRLMEE